MAICSYLKLIIFFSQWANFRKWKCTNRGRSYEYLFRNDCSPQRRVRSGAWPPSPSPSLPIDPGLYLRHVRSWTLTWRLTQDSSKLPTRRRLAGSDMTSANTFLNRGEGANSAQNKAKCFGKYQHIPPNTFSLTGCLHVSVYAGLHLNAFKFSELKRLFFPS